MNIRINLPLIIQALRLCLILLIIINIDILLEFHVPLYVVVEGVVKLVVVDF